MARILSGVVSSPRGGDDLIGVDPTGLHTLTIPLRAGQGRLRRGTFLTWDATDLWPRRKLTVCSVLTSIVTRGRTGMLFPSTPKADSDGARSVLRILTWCT